NLTGAMLCAREVLRDMVPRRSGNIINISSMAGRGPLPKRSPYVVSKWGMIGLTHNLAVEYGPHKIRANCICPGATEGERFERVLRTFAESRGEPYERALKRAVGRTPLGRLVTPEEVADSAVFLASDESSGMTGQIIEVAAGA
ncbi:MAG: SDR family oxidoreductase, partial [Dehalococcoidia bacterium]